MSLHVVVILAPLDIWQSWWPAVGAPWWPPFTSCSPSYPAWWSWPAPSPPMTLSSHCYRNTPPTPHTSSAGGSSSMTICLMCLIHLLFVVTCDLQQEERRDAGRVPGPVWPGHLHHPGQHLRGLLQPLQGAWHPLHVQVRRANFVTISRREMYTCCLIVVQWERYNFGQNFRSYIISPSIKHLILVPNESSCSLDYNTGTGCEIWT